MDTASTDSALSAYLVGFGAEDELVDSGCEDSSRKGTHPEDPLVVPRAGDCGRSEGTRRVDAVSRTHAQSVLSSDAA